MKTEVSESLLQASATEGAFRWLWPLLDYWLSLSVDLREAFWSELALWIGPGGQRLSPVARAEFFRVVWTTQRYWDTDAGAASYLLIEFHGIESDVRSDSDADMVRRIKSACSYLPEMDEADLNWTDFQLPVQRLSKLSSDPT